MADESKFLAFSHAVHGRFHDLTASHFLPKRASKCIAVSKTYSDQPACDTDILWRAIYNGRDPGRATMITPFYTSSFGTLDLRPEVSCEPMFFAVEIQGRLQEDFAESWRSFVNSHRFSRALRTRAMGGPPHQAQRH